ncbi:Lambda phage terminase A [Undibacterium sp. YM2]|uniref:terminase large subunit n=1 Tax=Undibacterium sp. YM2 TaxID=2058625 RepID=UPI001331F26F|nr:terminase TerL endonuclease subunit [Undibacterium sp. YM2]BBB65901.1 Lambda phage terminase A [Undibacterium sp. YM2]
MAETTKRRTTSDRVTAYAKSVVAKKVVAGPHVRDACARHLRDLEDGPARGLKWDKALAARAIGFFEDVLRLNGGQFEGKPFELQPWQAFIVGSLFGWLGPDGFRRFRVAYIETAKGSGKSPLAAGIGLYGLVSDGEARAEIYAAATKKDQAQILFRDAIAMVDQSPALRNRLEKAGSPGKEWNLAYQKTASFFRPIAADEGQSGPRPHIALIDEVHEHRNGHVIDMMRAGTKFRQQAMIVMITNSGTNKQTVCWENHEYGAKVSAGQLQDDAYFAYICALDIGDDPFKDEKCWDKVNPSLKYGIPGLKYLREQVTEARGMPSKESVVRRLNFCQWTAAESPWLPPEVWFDCADPDSLPISQFYGRAGTAGLDLSSTTDLTALVLTLDPTEDDQFTRLIPFFWLPGDGLSDKAAKDRVPYLAWRDAGHLEAVPGRAINKLHVAHKLSELCGLFEIRKISYDRWRIEDFKNLIENEGLSIAPLEPFGQGFKDMAPAVDEFERKLLESEIRHNNNPVMTWCMANAVVVSDPAGNRKIAKERATGRVDGAVAAVMAVGLLTNAVQEKSFWEKN